MLNEILPPTVNNTYHGAPIAKLAFAATTVLTLGRSLLHILTADSVHRNDTPWHLPARCFGYGRCHVCAVGTVTTAHESTKYDFFVEISVSHPAHVALCTTGMGRTARAGDVQAHRNQRDTTGGDRQRGFHCTGNGNASFPQKE